MSIVNLENRRQPHLTLLFCSKHTHADINTFFALKFDQADSIEWIRISAITLTLSLTVMSFVKIFMVWLLPQTFLGLAIIVMSVGFFVVAGACETIVVNSVGRSAVGVCSYVNTFVGKVSS